MKENVFFISGIDTNVGKTFATGMIARCLALRGCRVITQKMIQTGCTTSSEDVEMHRRLQGIDFMKEDREGITCPYIFSYPCSPHMAAEKDGKTIDTANITVATQILRQRYEVVLLEGAGGLMVPVDKEMLTIDYIRECGYPVILVTSGKLGSINHTLLGLYACRQYSIPVKALVYNLYPMEDPLITENTLIYLSAYLHKYHPETSVIRLPVYKENIAYDIDTRWLW